MIDKISFGDWLSLNNNRRHNTVLNYVNRLKKLDREISLYEDETELRIYLTSILNQHPEKTTLAAFRKYLEYLFETHDYSRDPINSDLHKEKKRRLKKALELPHSVVTKGKDKVYGKEYISAEATYQLLKHLEKVGDTKNYLITLFLYDSMCRPHELFGNKKHDPETEKEVIDWQQKTYFIPASIAKGRRPRTIELFIPKTLEVLKEYLDSHDSEYLFSPGGEDYKHLEDYTKIMKDGYNKALKKYCKEIGFPKGFGSIPTEYWWRHTRTTQLVKIMDEGAVRRRGGWKDTHMLNRYVEEGRDLDTMTLEAYLIKNNLRL
jgi:integrase